MRTPKCQEELLGLFFLCCRILHLKSPRTRWVPWPRVYSTGGVKDHERVMGGLPSRQLSQMLLRPLLFTSCWPDLSHMVMPRSKGNWEIPHSFVHLF